MSSTPEQPTTDATQWQEEAQRHMAAGDPVAAVGLLSRLVLLTPEADIAWTTLAEAHLAAGAAEAAVQAGLKAVDLMPVSLPAWTVLADALAAAGQWEDALTAAVQQFELFPVVPDGLYKAAVAHVQLDDALGAIRALEAALSQRRALRDRLRTDVRFDSIRDHAGFRLLLD